MKNIKKILMKVLIINLMLLLAIGLFFALFNNASFYPIQEIKRIDKSISGELLSSDIIEMEDGNFLFVNKDTYKKYNLLKNKIKKEYFFPYINKIGKRYFKNQTDFNGTTKLFANISESSVVKLHYDNKILNNEILTASLPSKKIEINGQKINIQEKEVGTGNNIQKKSLVEIGNDLYDVSELNDIEMTFENLRNGKIKIFKLVNDNLLQDDSSFENNLWRENVWNCQTDKAGANVEMETSDDSTDGNSSLKLISNPGNACVNKTFSIKVDRDKLYKLSFDYKNLKGKNVKYYYRLKNSKNQDLGYSFTEMIGAKDNEWHNFAIVIDPKKIVENLLDPEHLTQEDDKGFNVLDAEELEKEKTRLIKNIDQIDIYFYAPSNKGEVVNLYDNVKLSEYEFDRGEMVNLDIENGDKIILADKIQLKEGENEFKYIGNEINLLGNEENSFESNLWREKVWNCQANKVGTNVKMEASDDSTDGNSSLKLISNPGNACVNKTFTTKLSFGRTYKLIFDYKNIKGNRAMVYYNLHGSNDNMFHVENIKIKNHGWNTYELLIDPKISNVKSIDIYFYAPSDGKEVVNLYDNVRLVEWLPKDIDSYYLYAEQKVDESPSLKSVEYKGINRWKNRVVLHGVKKSFLLAYPEKYSEKWKAYQTEILPEVEIDERKLNGYVVPEIESNRQATKDKVKEFINNGLISAVGNKFISKNFDGSIRNDNLSNGWWGETLFKPTIPEDTHYQINNYGNSWWVDLDQLCKANEGNDKCIKNDDGTYDIELVIENKLNRYISILYNVTVVIFISLLSYLGYDWYRRRKNIS